MIAAFERLPNELLHRIALVCHWSAITSLASISPRFYDVARRIIQRDIAFYLGLYLETEAEVSVFLEVLQKTSGAIIGGVARCIISPQWMQPILREVSPHCIDILLPYSAGRSLDSWRRFLERCNYRFGRMETFWRNSARILRMEHKVCHAFHSINYRY